MLKNILITLGIVLLLAIAAIGVQTFVTRHENKEIFPVISKSPTAQTKSASAPVFNKKRFSNSEPASMWVVVNKHRALSPATYIPADLVTPNVPVRVPGNDSMQLRRESATALERMFIGAKADELDLMLSSGYRSFQFQTSLYGSYVTNSSATEADKTSARPGYSEHQTGLAADIEPLSQKCDVDVCFATTPEGIWLAANAYKYGFILRYTKDKLPVTGYSYEPWHVRYVGIDLTNELHKQKITTLEEFFGLGNAPDYL